jgi:hypothetical protein
MNKRIRELVEQAYPHDNNVNIWRHHERMEKFAELTVKECINREELLGAIARGWCHEKNSHKTMDSDLALAIFDEVEQQIRKHFGVEE